MLPLRLRDTLQRLSLQYVALEREGKRWEDRKMLLAFLGWGGLIIAAGGVLFRNPEINDTLAGIGVMAACVCGLMYLDGSRADRERSAEQLRIQAMLKGVGLTITSEGFLSDGASTYDPMYTSSYTKDHT